MCGILACFLSVGAPSADRFFSKSLDTMRQRGPDASGIWNDVNHEEVWLGHRRLAIVDLDDRSRQPMHSVQGRFVILFNGEIYNYESLRRKLIAEGVIFRTKSDTEVLLELYARHGEDMLGMLHGMFAIVIWDKVTRTAFAARDPYGIKPLYVGVSEAGVVLASQVKAVLATQIVSHKPDLIAQAGFWMLGSVPEPRTWFQDISALPSGGCLRIQHGRVIARRVWQDLGQAWRSSDTAVSNSVAVFSDVAAALRESVDRHLVADVPVGVFLSGGIDSGALAALMVERGAKDLCGITLAFDEFTGRHEDEAPVAQKLAKYYGIHHHVRRVGREEFVEDLPRILSAMDQPSIDGINSWYASKAVAEVGLKVVVSGVGGDELFQGYEHFQRIDKMRRLYRRFGPVSGCNLTLNIFGRVQFGLTGNSRWKYFSAWCRTVAGAWWLRRSVCSPDDLPALMGEDAAREALVGFDAVAEVERMVGVTPVDTRVALGQIESMIYMRNQLLRDSDWSSMNHSVELRTPLVDSHLLRQVSHHLPHFHKFPNKRLLACAPARALPEDIINRRKSGFGIPVLQWAEGLLPRGTSANSTLVWAKYVAENCYKDFR